MCNLRFRLLERNESTGTVPLVAILWNLRYERHIHTPQIAIMINLIVRKVNRRSDMMDEVTAVLDDFVHFSDCETCAALAYTPLDAWFPGATMLDFIECGRSPKQQIMREEMHRDLHLKREKWEVVLLYFGNLSQNFEDPDDLQNYFKLQIDVRCPE